MAEVLAGHLKYPIRQARDALRFLDQYTPTIPDELFLLAAVLPFPGERMLDIAVVFNGEEKEGERVLHPLRSFMKPFEDRIKSKPLLGGTAGRIGFSFRWRDYSSLSARRPYGAPRGASGYRYHHGVRVVGAE